MISTLQYTPTFVFLASVGLALILIRLSAIDITSGRIPDWLTLTITILGLIVTWIIKPDFILYHASAALAGFFFFYFFNAVYVKLRSRQGLGGGDAKLFGAAGTWVGYQGLPSVLLFASTSALILVLGFMLCRKRMSFGSAIAFGPHLSIGFWITWVFGPVQF